MLLNCGVGEDSRESLGLQGEYSSVTPMLGNLKSATGPQDGSLPFCKLRGLGLMLSKGPPNGTHANDVLGGLAFGFESQLCHRATWQRC